MNKEIEKIRKEWKEWIKRLRKNHSCNEIQANCEFCKFVGGEPWHCKNPDALKCHINVWRTDVCKHWLPNIGLMLYLESKKRDKRLKKSRKAFKEFHEKIKQRKK